MQQVYHYGQPRVGQRHSQRVIDGEMDIIVQSRICGRVVFDDRCCCSVHVPMPAVCYMRLHDRAQGV